MGIFAKKSEPKGPKPKICTGLTPNEIFSHKKKLKKGTENKNCQKQVLNGVKNGIIKRSIIFEKWSK